MKRILLIRFKSIGDVLFTLPAVNVMRENFPDVKITFLVSKENAPLLNGFRAVDEVVALDHAAFRNPFLAAPEMFRLLRRLRAGKFSLVADFQGYGETAWLSWTCGAPERWGIVYRKLRAWAYTCNIERDKKIHPAEWNLSLLRAGGLKISGIRNEFVLPDEFDNEARKFFSENRLDTAVPTIYLQPFTSSPEKNWPLENFLGLAKHFQSKDVQIIFGGGPSERQKLEPARAAGFAVAAGTPLMVSAGLIKLSAMAIGADTGLTHLAVALGKRVVMLMGSAAPGRPHPFQHADWALTPLSGKNVADISVQRAIAAAQDFLLKSGAMR